MYVCMYVQGRIEKISKEGVGIWEMGVAISSVPHPEINWKLWHTISLTAINSGTKNKAVFNTVTPALVGQNNTYTND